MLQISIAPLFHPRTPQSKISGDFDEILPKATFQGCGFTPQGKVQGKFTIYRSSADVIVTLNNVILPGNIECARCLKTENISISFSGVQQVFYANKREAWGEEEFCIDHHKGRIDLLPFLRQELLVHLPMPFLHPDSTKCDQKMVQKLAVETKENYDQPFADLKKIVKTSKIQ